VPPDGIQAGFNGDYTGLTINFDVQAHPVWSDTRNRDPFAPNNGVTVDEDYFTVSRNLPSGRASASSLLAPPEPITAPALPPARYTSGSTLDLMQGIQR
jgi:hypothetical protein